MFISEFRAYLADGEMQRIAKDRSGREHVVDPAWVSDERDAARIERQKREEVLACEAKAAELGRSYKSARKDIEELCAAKGWDLPCERTVRYWRRSAHSHQSMLSPLWFRCGNRQQGPDISTDGELTALKCWFPFIGWRPRGSGCRWKRAGARDTHLDRAAVGRSLQSVNRMRPWSRLSARDAAMNYCQNLRHEVATRAQGRRTAASMVRRMQCYGASAANPTLTPSQRILASPVGLRFTSVAHSAVPCSL